MSVTAVKLAYQQHLPGQSSVKFLLVTFAQLHHHEDTSWEVYAAVEYLVNATNMNRKTVLKGLERLRELGYLAETGKFAGRNGCIPVYQLRFPSTQPCAADNGGNTYHRSSPMPTSSFPPPMSTTMMTTPTFKPAPAPTHEPAEPTAGSVHPIDKAWTLPDEWRAWAKRQKPHWDDSRIDTVATIFHVHWRSVGSQKEGSRNWLAEWQKWVLRERNDASLRPSTQQPAENAALEPAQCSDQPLSDDQAPYLADVPLNSESLDYAAIGTDIRRAMEELGTDDMVEAMSKLNMLGNREARRAARRAQKSGKAMSQLKRIQQKQT